MPYMGNINQIEPEASGLADALFSTSRQKVLGIFSVILSAVSTHLS